VSVLRLRVEQAERLLRQIESAPGEARPPSRQSATDPEARFLRKRGGTIYLGLCCGAALRYGVGLGITDLADKPKTYVKSLTVNSVSAVVSANGGQLSKSSTKSVPHPLS
jgi:hypothetical protein